MLDMPAITKHSQFAPTIYPNLFLGQRKPYPSPTGDGLITLRKGMISVLFAGPMPHPIFGIPDLAEVLQCFYLTAHAALP